MTRFCLLWDNHNTNLVQNLTELYEAQQYLDITLRCENTDIGVHKCVLVSGSSYFKEHLRKNSSSTIVLIKSVQLKILKLLIEFIYKGEIYVEESDVPSILIAAKFFQITGLSGINLHELDPSFQNILPQINNFEEPEFIQAEIIEDVLNNLSNYKTEQPDIISNSDFTLNTFNHESNEKDFEEKSLFLQEKIPEENYEITETRTEEIVNEEYTETEVEAIAEDYLSSASNAKIKPHDNVIETIASDENIPNLTNELVVPDEHFEDEEYLEEHLESLDEDSLVYTEPEKYKNPETSKALQVLQEAGVPTDVPIYCEGNDGSFVELTKDVLEEIASGGQVIYQVVDEEGKPGELLLGSTVKQQLKPSASQESEISTNTVYDKLVLEALSTPSPTSLSFKNEAGNVTPQLIENTETVENSVVKGESTKSIRERKVNSRYFNSNLTSPFLELTQRKAQKRTQSPKEQNGYEKFVKVDNFENPECDLIERKIAELHADFSADLTNIITTVVDNQSENKDISEVLNDSESNDVNIVKLASKRRKNKRFFKLFDSPKMITENKGDCEQIIASKRKKTNSETSNTSSQSTGKEIPYALGLLPLRKALKKIQNMPDHTPRKTRSNILLNKTQ